MSGPNSTRVASRRQRYIRAPAAAKASPTIRPACAALWVSTQLGVCNNTLGVCPKNAKGHDGSQSGNYVLSHQSGPGQQDTWFWCRGCQGLFFGGAGTLGVCPVNANGHDPSMSGNYILSLTTG